MRLRQCTAFCLSILLLPYQLLAQPPAAQKFELTVDSIMRGPDLVGYAPSGVYWSRDSQRVYFRWKRAGEPRLKQPDLYVVNRDGSGLRKLTEAEMKLAPPATGELSKDKKLTVFTDEGDVVLYDHTKNERRPLTKTTDGESNAHFTQDQKHVYFTRQNNLYTLSLTDGTLVQITDIRPGPPPPDPNKKGTDSQETLKKEERQLLAAVQERAAYREEQEAKRKEREKRKPYYLPPGQTPGNLSLTPDEKYVIVSVIEPGREAKNAIVPNYVTESAYTEDIPARNKVGDVQSKTRLALVNAESGEVKFVEHGLTDPPKNPEDKSDKPRERDVRFFALKWSEDGTKAVVMARSADNKDRWIMKLDPVTAKVSALDHLHDEAWVGGGGFGGDLLGWLPDNQTIYFVSERDGYAHLYTMNASGGAAKQLTKGAFEVSDIEIAEDKTRFYFTSSEGKYSATQDWKTIGEPFTSDDISSFSRHLYAMNFDGSNKRRITNLKGNNQVSLAPDGAMLAVLRSYSNQPTELYLAANNASAEAKQITTSPLDEFARYNWIAPPIVQFKARDGAFVPARIYKPKNYQRGGPAVVFVHGAGYLQNVHQYWSSYFREYMFHHLLMERGFLVLDIDYRASSGYGRDWRTGIYRHMGGKDLSDQVDGAKYLVSEHGVDAKRIGIYGGSYGGFMTLMAMFTEPDVFAAGAALRPVTDWAHYNHGYTSNILNSPQADAEAYKKSSPIYFAQGLKGALLICHGMVDVNVHFQDSVRLAQRLIELKKENWELALYPVEDHGFERASSWADEYKRILKLFTQNLQPAPQTEEKASKTTKKK